MIAYLCVTELCVLTVKPFGLITDPKAGRRKPFYFAFATDKMLCVMSVCVLSYKFIFMARIKWFT